MLLTVDLERLDVGPGQLALDAGCGEGCHCFGMLERGAKVIGLDLDFESMRLASKRLRSRAKVASDRSWLRILWHWSGAM